MPRKKKIVEELSPKEKAKKSASFDFAIREAEHAGEPSYKFSVGDAVAVGNLRNCIVDEVCDNGRYYCIRSGNEMQDYGYWAWTSVRPVIARREAVFAQKDSPLVRCSFSNRSIESLIHMHYSFGIDFDPDYQRGSVWDDTDRAKLLDSIFAGRSIGKFVLRRVPYDESLAKNCLYEVVDGKQRLLTLTAFYENRFVYHGYTYNDLPQEDKNWLKSAMTSVLELPESTTEKEVLEVFIAINQNGKPVDDAVIKHAKSFCKRRRKMDNARYVVVQHTSDEDVGDSGLCYVMPKLYDTVDAAKAAANKALETDAEECPKGEAAAITDSDIKEYFSDAPEYYAGEKDVYGGRHYHNVYAVFRMTM